MYSASVGREVYPKVRIVTVAVTVTVTVMVTVTVTIAVWFVVISATVTTVPRIVTMVSVGVIDPVTIFIVVSVNRAKIATPCLRWRRPSHQKHNQKNGYYNFTDVIHFDPPFILINRTKTEKGYRFIKKLFC
jgi:hypothetical protein